MRTAFFIDIAENIHIHYRDLRMEFSRDEYFDFMRQMNELHDGVQEWKDTNPDWTESDPETFNNKTVEWIKNKTPYDMPLKPHSDYWDSRISIEKNVNGVYHVHWRNYRFEMIEDGFKEWVKAFEVTATMFKPSHKPFIEFVKRPLRKVPPLVRLARLIQRPFPSPAPLPVDPAFYRRHLSQKKFTSSIEKIRLIDLRVALWQDGRKSLVPIDTTPASKYLIGEEKEYRDYCKAQNASGPRSVSRFRKLIRSVNKNGIDAKKLIITLDGVEILDGQHRAALYLHMLGDDAEIQVVNIKDVHAAN